MLSVEGVEDGTLLVNGSFDIPGSVASDTIVQRNCFLHVRGNLRGSLTVEAGARVIVEGSVDGKIINRGGRLVVNNKGLAACVTVDGPAEAEAAGILRINLTAIVCNWEALAKRAETECAAVVQGNAYGCGIDQVVAALVKCGCKTFFVANIPEARRVRAAAPKVTIYVLNGLYAGNAPAFAEVNAIPVINSSIELAEWDIFVAARQWTGGCALNVDTGARKCGLSIDEAAAMVPRIHSSNPGVALLMSRLDHPEKPNDPLNDRQISRLQDLRRLYSGVPASIAGSAGIFIGARAQFDLVRAGAALFGVNPLPGTRNPMMPVLEWRARIVQVRTLERQETIDGTGWAAKRRTRLALVSTGYADGYPRPDNVFDNRMHVIIGGHRCPVVGRPSMNLLPIDVTDLPDQKAARFGEPVTLIGGSISVDDFAAAARLTGREVLGRLGSRFHRIYYAG